MARIKEVARKSTDNGGFKRKRANEQARQAPVKKSKTQEQGTGSEGSNDDLEPETSAQSDESDPEEPPKKKSMNQQKSRQSRSEKEDAKNETSKPSQTDYDESIAARNPALLSDLIAQTIGKHFKDVTSLEQSDMSVSSTAFKDTTSFENPHTAENLPSFLESYVPGGKEALSTCNENGSPHTAIVVASGMRVADLYRSLLVFNNQNSKVGKIIAKHMKLSGTVNYLKGTKVGIAITTPQRLTDLIKEGAVSLDSLQRIVIDGSYRNEKKQSMLTMKETFKQLIELMNMEDLKARLGAESGRVELIMF